MQNKYDDTEYLIEREDSIKSLEEIKNEKENENEY